MLSRTSYLAYLGWAAVRSGHRVDAGARRPERCTGRAISQPQWRIAARRPGYSRRPLSAARQPASRCSGQTAAGATAATATCARTRMASVLPAEERAGTTPPSRAQTPRWRRSLPQTMAMMTITAAEARHRGKTWAPPPAAPRLPCSTSAACSSAGLRCRWTILFAHARPRPANQKSTLYPRKQEPS